MHAAGERPETVTPDPRPLRTAQLLRAAVLFITGAVIAFTATLHWQVEFDVLMVLGGLTLIGIATLYEYYVYRGTAESWWLAARAIIAFGGAGALLAVTGSVSLALVIAIWAALTATITALRLVRGAQAKRVALPSLLLSVALAASVLLVREDPIAVTGFFGAYAVIRGVFLGIASFDASASGESETTPPREASASTHPNTGIEDD
jgi:hypothetical protein